MDLSYISINKTVRPFSVQKGMNVKANSSTDKMIATVQCLEKLYSQGVLQSTHESH